jgi:hypothetical protein
MRTRVMVVGEGMVGGVVDADMEGHAKIGDWVAMGEGGKVRKAKAGELGIGVVMRGWCPEGCLWAEELP